MQIDSVLVKFPPEPFHFEKFPPFREVRGWTVRADPDNLGV
jgi:hypothetical protein